MRGLSRSHRLLAALVMVVFLGGVAALGVAQPQALASLWPTTRPSAECGGYHPCHSPRPSRPPVPPATPPATPPVSAPPSPSPSAPGTPQLPQTGPKINALTVVGVVCVFAGLALYASARRRPRSRHRRA